MYNIFKALKDRWSKKEVKLDVMTTSQTLDYIIKNKCSISRFGDGELFLMQGGTKPHYQKGQKELAKKLAEIKTTDKCLLCMPDVFDQSRFNRKTLTSLEYNFWKSFQKSYKTALEKYKDMTLGDAFISRFYIRYKNHDNTKDVINKLKAIWDNKNLIFVEGDRTRLGVGNNLFDNAKSIRRVICPNTDAFSKYDEIKNYLLENVKPTDVVICALGPTASVLAYELSENMQILDLGHLDIEYEWFLMGAKKKVPIKHKFVNECILGRNPKNLEDEEYASQIIKHLD